MGEVVVDDKLLHLCEGRLSLGIYYDLEALALEEAEVKVHQLLNFLEIVILEQASFFAVFRETNDFDFGTIGVRARNFFFVELGSRLAIIEGLFFFDGV
jgi:hypothetical protein